LNCVKRQEFEVRSVALLKRSGSK